SFDVTQDNSPFVDGDVICAADLDNNGDIDQTEIDYCLDTDIANKKICPYEMTDCQFETKPPICPSGSSFNPADNQCETVWSCPPGGYTLSGDVCISYSQITCLSSGSYSASLQRCIAGLECPPGYWFSSSDCACVSSSFWCSAGTYNSTKKLCEATPGAGNVCPSGFAYNETDDVCEGSPSCTFGSFNSATEQCLAGTSCTSGYSVNCDANRCEAVPSCSDGSSFNTTTNRCETPTICLPGFTRTDHNCQADPTCPPCNLVFNPTTHLCQGDQCPHNHDSVCYECIPLGGINKCSPYSCYVYPHFQNTDTQQGTNDKQDNGIVDSNGNCLGTIYIFNGKDMRCRKAGIETGFFNCCDGGDTWFGLGKCKGEEEQLSTQKSKGLCHYIGDYCSNEWPLVGCVQRKKTYCCFNSKLGRILQEQGRETLQAFGPTGNWGTSKSPNCRGFTAEEFQMLNFDNIDLSEWYGDIVTRTQGNIENTMQDKVQNFYNETH
ncbi:MAG: conjugal transfer protein TraN, partial [Desulfatiglandaceae bacterium]